MTKIEYVKNKYFFPLTDNSVIIESGCPSIYGLPDTSQDELCKNKKCSSCWNEVVRIDDAEKAEFDFQLVTEQYK